jgi:hypothetical protein
MEKVNNPLPSAEIIERINFLKLETEKPNCATELFAELENIRKEYEWCDIVFEENGKKGLKDVSGKIRVPAMYSDFPTLYHYFHFRNVPVIAQNEQGLYGLVKVDGSGDAITDFEYEYMDLEQWSCRFVAAKNGHCGIMNHQGHLLVPCELDGVCREIPINGHILVTLGNKKGIYNYVYDLYIKPIYDEIEEKDDKVYVRLGNQWGYLDEDGNFIDENDEETLDEVCVLYWNEA